MNEHEIESLANQISEQYNPQNLSPFPFEHIQEQVNDLVMYYRPLPTGVSGVIFYEKSLSKYIIVIDENKPKVRQFFTIAHELGHYFMHKEIIKSEDGLIDDEDLYVNNLSLFRMDEGQRNVIETEANRFAAALIMPKNLVIKAWNELKKVEDCAHIFNVSMSAMSIRLERLNLI